MVLPRQKRKVASEWSDGCVLVSINSRYLNPRQKITLQHLLYTDNQFRPTLVRVVPKRNTAECENKPTS